jgi:hypothetical protein
VALQRAVSEVCGLHIAAATAMRFCVRQSGGVVLDMSIWEIRLRWQGRRSTGYRGASLGEVYTDLFAG